MGIVDKNNTIGRDLRYRDHLEKISAQGECPFCPERLREEHPKPIFLENGSWVATDNAYPYKGTSEHVLLIAKPHLERLEEVEPPVWADLGDIYKMVVDCRAIKGAAFLMRSGDTSLTGASVNHLHAHIIQGAERHESSAPIFAVTGFQDPSQE